MPRDQPHVEGESNHRRDADGRRDFSIGFTLRPLRLRGCLLAEPEHDSKRKPQIVLSRIHESSHQVVGLDRADRHGIVQFDVYATTQGSGKRGIRQGQIEGAGARA